VNATIYQDDYDPELSIAAAESTNLVNGVPAVGNCTNIGPVKTRHKINYEALRPFFLNVKAEVVRQTITNTTQFAHNILAGPNMMKIYKSPFPACNVRRRNEAVATDMTSSFLMTKQDSKKLFLNYRLTPPRKLLGYSLDRMVKCTMKFDSSRARQSCGPIT
jgi:hypothetical protein